MNKKKNVKGVKNNAIMSLVPFFSVIFSLPPDYMHAILLGIAKLIIMILFDPKNKNEPYYLGKKIKDYDSKLLGIKPPFELSRPPMSISKRKRYNANNWKHHTCFYSMTCLISVAKLPKKYLDHWFLFVYSVNIFLKNKISDEDFELATKAMEKFVEGIEPLYGKQFMRINVHLLLHTPKFVKMYGPIWAWSAFPFEHYNGVLKNLFHGTQGVTQQICVKHILD